VSADGNPIGTWSKHGHYGSAPDKVIEMFVSLANSEDQPVGVVTTVREARSFGYDGPGADGDLLYISGA
jgi:hypothetical protein